MTRATVCAWMALLLSVVAGAARGQPSALADAAGTLSGRVIDARTSEPIAGAWVTVGGSGRVGQTDRDGEFLIRYVPEGEQVVTFAAPGYREWTVSVEFAAGRLSVRDAMLVSRDLEADPVVVTASRSEQTAGSAAASVVILDAAEIDARQTTTFDQAMQALPGVFAFRSTPISVQSMSIRGSSDVAGGGVGNRVLLLVDGRPALTSDAGGAFWSLVPTGFIDRVEVVKGAFSSLYGSTAMGGVVNVITRRPDKRGVLTLDVRGGVYEKPDPAIAFSDERSYQSQVQLSYSGARDRVSYLVSASRKQSDGHAEGTEYEFGDLYAKLLFDLQRNRNLELTLGGGRSDADYPHAWLSSADPLEIRDRYTDDRQEKSYGSVDLHYWAVPSPNRKYSARFYYYDHTQQSFFNENDPDFTLPGNEPFGFETSIDGAKIGSVMQLDLHAGDRHYLVAGVDVQVDHVESSPDTILYGNHQLNNIAVFAQDDIVLTSRLSLSVGGRYDRNHLVGGRTLDEVSPKVGLVAELSSSLTARALAGRAFRAPTIAERFLEEEIGGGIDFLPNPALEPERMTGSYELGLRWSSDWGLSADVAAFRYDYEDLIFWADVAGEFGSTQPLFQVRNLTSARMQGLEFEVQGQRGGVRGGVNYTFLDATDRSPDRLDDVLAYRPRHSLNADGSVEWRRWRLGGDLRYRSDIEEVFLFPRQAPDAYLVIGSTLQWQVHDRVRLSLRANNLFDEAYEELARYRMPGRNWILGTTVRF